MDPESVSRGGVRLWLGAWVSAKRGLAEVVCGGGVDEDVRCM